MPSRPLFVKQALHRCIFVTLNPWPGARGHGTV